MRVVVMGIASLPEIQDVENVPSYAEWLAEPNYVALSLRPDALMIVPQFFYRSVYPFNPSATEMMLRYRPTFEHVVHGNALVAGISEGKLTDCPPDILRLFEPESPDG